MTRHCLTVGGDGQTLTGSKLFCQLGSSGVVLDDANGDFILLTRSKTSLIKCSLSGWKRVQDFPILFFLEVQRIKMVILAFLKSVMKSKKDSLGT